MATNLVAFNVYQINQTAGFGGSAASQRFAFPTQGFLIRDTIGSTNRSLSTGYNVYSALQAPDGTLYYVTETISTVITAFNA